MKSRKSQWIFGLIASGAMAGAVHFDINLTAAVGIERMIRLTDVSGQRGR